MCNTNIHDHIVRAILGDKEIAIDYFKSCLPPEIQHRLDFSTLLQLPDTYLSKQLRKTMSDIVYSCRCTDSSTARISLLIEHKSYYDPFTPVQLGCYIFSALQKQLENDRQLSVIIPILLYHGKRKFEYQTLAGLFGTADALWKRFLPDFEYVYHDLGVMSDEQVAALNNKFLAAWLLALKHTFNKKWLEEHIEELVLFAATAAVHLQQKLYIYLFTRGEFSERKIEEITGNLPETVKATIMTTAQMYIEKGRLQGRAEGRAEGQIEGRAIEKMETTRQIAKSLKLKGMDLTQICEVTGLAIDEIKRL